MTSSSTSSIQKTFKYDVFLSFRGVDTRKNFIDHLYDALTRKGINTYKDDESICKGRRISDELIRSIEDSKFYIIVFSKNYTSSSWCLEELVKIMECQKMDEHTAYPVFFDVEPTEIRKQTGSVKRAFAKHRNEKDAGKWRDSLKEAADLAGWELKNTANGHEAKFIQQIVETISLELCCHDSSIDGNLVGMEARVKDIVSSLKIGIDEFRMIGIKGMGGAGKTTLARAVYDQISIQFEGSSFVENVREASNDSSKGLKSLQKQILSDVLNEQRIKVSGVFDGKSQMKKMLCGRKVLVVLDDVDHIEQLKALAGEPNWFKTGSRIIITTRDEQVLIAHRVNFISDVNLLLHEEAIYLFSRHAFGTEIPIKGYKELSEKVVHYAAGLPLTISVLGSFLCGKSDDVWTDAIERLKTIPLKETLEKLELSYTGLEDDYKQIFLDVACILKGWKKDNAITALESCGFYAKNGLKVLQQKSLITISSYGFLGMHDHIEEMGMNIVRRMHPNQPHKHSRLWIDEEIKHILASNLGTEATRCITFWNMEPDPATIMKGLVNMKELRLLQVNYCGKGFVFNDQEFDELSQCLPNSLQFMSWDGYPFTCLPKNFRASNLTGLEMRGNSIISLWEEGERKVLEKLRFIDLSHSMLRILDLTLIPNLETLILRDCRDLVELKMRGNSIISLWEEGERKVLEKLRFIDLSRSMLRILDLTLIPNLETLILQDCHDLVDLDMHFGCQKLRFLNLRGSMLSVLDLGPTPNLEVLNLKYCHDLVQLHMPCESPKLKSLILCGTNLRGLDLGATPNLEVLQLPNDLIELHMCGESPKIKSLELILPKLRTLDLAWSPKLKSLMLDVPPSIFRTLDLARTSNLETLRVHCLYNFEELGSIFKSICSLKCLRELMLAAGIPEVPKDLHQLERLEVLILSFTNISHLPNSICMVKHLKVLKVDNCHLLEQLPEDLNRLECLEKLILSCAKIKHLPNSICMLKHLKVLRLDNCCILEQLPEDVGRLECLEDLFLWCEKLKQLPNSICMLKRLKLLCLPWCYLLEQLPEDLGRLECLEELTLGSKKIKHLPNSICMLKHLKLLRLNFCELLEQLPEDLGRIEHLEWLELMECLRLSDLPNSICEMKHLKFIDIRGCILVEKLPEELGCVKCLKDYI